MGRTPVATVPPIGWRAIGATHLRRGGWVIPVVDWIAVALSAATLGTVAPLYALAVVGLVAATGCYRPRFAPDLGLELPRLIGLASMATLAVALVKGGDAAMQAEVVRAAPVAIAALVVGRLLAYPLLRRYRALPSVRQPTVVIGAGNVGVAVVGKLQANPGYGLHPVGFVDVGIGDEEATGLPVPILGGVLDLRRVIAEHGVRQVIVAYGRTREVDLVEVIRAAERDDVEIHLVPRLFELGSSVVADQVGGIPLVRLQRAAMRPGAWRAKRTFDLGLTALVLAVIAPLLLVLATLVKLSSPGPVLFKQRRVGQHGRPIDVLKFRTMQVNDDSDSTWSVRQDPRVTSIGRVLRRTSLDELPQLINVLRGDMSLVGPRPERPAFDEQYRTSVPRYGDRLRVPVGLTGLAQIHGLRGDTSIAERVWFDNRYIEDWSLWRDITILVRTFIAVIRDPERGSLPDDDQPTTFGWLEYRSTLDLREGRVAVEAGVG